MDCVGSVADTLDLVFDSDPAGSILRLIGFDVGCDGCDPTDAGTGVAAVFVIVDVVDVAAVASVAGDVVSGAVAVRAAVFVAGVAARVLL